ncbi:MAG TPA: T9SS type A sorting domain-containing protein [Bacteroidota bacterium]|nr:T9SS type A sorting domain-containing protein [Bacteroidota bacterium]
MIAQRNFLTALIVVTALAATCVQAGRPVNSRGVRKVTTNNTYRPMDINSVFNYYSNVGDGSYNPFSGTNEGFEYPKGSGKFVIFEDGIVWGGFQNGTLKVGGSTYNHGLQAGKILRAATVDSPAVADDPGLSKYHIYRVRPDVNPNTPFDATMQAKLGNEEVPYINEYESYSAQDLYNQYIADWNAWPGDEGAPYTDVNHDGIYEPGTDIPGVPGADQTMWYVANDLNQTLTENLYGSDPIGIEMQRTIWAYKSKGDVLQNVIFMGTKIINESAYPLDSCFITQWSDPDLGGTLGANTNLPGCDTTRKLGYVYSGVAVNGGYGVACPAGGFVFFQGPWIPGGANDSAIFDLQYRHGRKPLGMTGFNFFINARGNIYSDPELQSIAGTQEFYNLMNGTVASTGAPFVNPLTGDTAKFLFPGDPVTGTGWTADYTIKPQDVRIALNSGPFTLQVGDTQQVVVACLAGVGGDRMSSISVLRYYTDIAQQAYNNLFNLPSAPPQPNLTATELDGEVLLNWADTTEYPKTESQNDLGYKFEGYDVYQLKDNSWASPKLLATFDVNDGIGTIRDYVYDATLKDLIYEPVENGTDNGIQRYYAVKADAFQTFGTNLVNGQKYYFGVKAYNFNPTPGLVGNHFSSYSTVIQVIPHQPDLGVRLHSNVLDTIGVTHTAGNADGSLTVNIVDPTKLTGHKYQFQVVVTDSIYDSTAQANLANPRWELVDVTRGNVVVKQPSTSYAGFSPGDTIIDGMQVGINASPFWVSGKELAAQTYTPAADFNWTGVNNGGPFFGGGLFVANGFITGGLNPWQVNESVEIIFDSSNGQNAYDFERDQGGSATAPYIGFFPQPFRVYDVTDPAHPRQIDFAFMEKTGFPTDDHVWAPGPTSGNREYFWFVGDNYTATAKAEYAGGNVSSVLSTKPVYWAGWYTLTDPSLPAYKNGDVWMIKATSIVTSADVWAFDTGPKQKTFSNALEQADVNKINVFPNPYFGFNQAETDKYSRFVTFSHLPKRATIRVFNLAGTLVRRIEKTDPTTQFAQWDLRNESSIPVAAGMYIVYIDLPDQGATKILKLGIIPETQFLDAY